MLCRTILSDIMFIVCACKYSISGWTSTVVTNRHSPLSKRQLYSKNFRINCLVISGGVPYENYPISPVILISLSSGSFFSEPWMEEEGVDVTRGRECGGGGTLD